VAKNGPKAETESIVEEECEMDGLVRTYRQLYFFSRMGEGAKVCFVMNHDSNKNNTKIIY
jgi:hypothetical protein